MCVHTNVDLFVEYQFLIVGYLFKKKRIPIHEDNQTFKNRLTFAPRKEWGAARLRLYPLNLIRVMPA